MFAMLVSAAYAGEGTTREALDRLDEILHMRVSEGVLSPDDVLPAILVSAQPRYEASAPWFSTRAIEVVQDALGTSGLRLCEACMAPRVWVENGALAYQTGPVGLDEIARLDDTIRGDAPAARSAIWIDEVRGGLSVRIVDLRTGRVLLAQNIDPSFVEKKNTQRMETLSEELERRARGDSLMQGFADFALYPGQHISLEWTDQWGPSNANFTGVTLSILDPLLGLGASEYRRIPILNSLLGVQLLVSLPTALSQSIGGADVIDPLLTGVAVVRVPFGRSNFGACATLSTNGTVGLGITLMNIHFLPLAP